ncbi:MAG: hypothetical protein EB133_11895, partial [Betaproteobacteria bacterium]|nr:hypothetical protein [Betaproteobacteria bacterium]
MSSRGVGIVAIERQSAHWLSSLSILFWSHRMPYRRPFLKTSVSLIALAVAGTVFAMDPRFKDANGDLVA